MKRRISVTVALAATLAGVGLGRAVDASAQRITPYASVVTIYNGTCAAGITVTYTWRGFKGGHLAARVGLMDWSQDQGTIGEWNGSGYKGRSGVVSQTFTLVDSHLDDKGKPFVSDVNAFGVLFNPQGTDSMLGSYVDSSPHLQVPCEAPPAE